jgi:hypothetical protein
MVDDTTPLIVDKIDRYEVCKICPVCERPEKLRPFGADILTSPQGGQYYRVCEPCNIGFAFKKQDSSIVFKGPRAAFGTMQNARRKAGLLL